MNKLKYALLTLCTIASCQAFAGGWVGGGGDILGNEFNPWFLGNVKSVSYCVFVNQHDVSLPEEKVRERIADAWHYWKEEFKFAYYPGVVTGLPSLSPAMGIGIQTFIESDCPNSLEDALKKFDVVFQVGILNRQQKNFLEDPTRHVAVAVRTDFDTRSLRGKGFVYIAPDLGPLRPFGNDHIENAWSQFDGAILTQVAAHELGHVFGLTHNGAGYGLMGAEYPAMALTKIFNGTQASPIPNVFKPLTEFGGTGASRECEFFPHQYDFALEYFNAPSTDKCLSITVSGNSLIVATSPSATAPFTIVGEAKLEQPKIYDWNVPSIRIGISKAQRVFTYISPIFENQGFIPGAMPLVRSYKTMYVSRRGGLMRPITFLQGPSTFQVMGTRQNGEIVDNIALAL